jgi:hypothetical protein
MHAQHDEVQRIMSGGERQRTGSWGPQRRGERIEEIQIWEGSR